MRALKIVLFVLVWASCSWFGSWEYNPNNATRLFAAISLVEDGDATIDEFAGLTIDKAVFGGHVYLDKAPGMTLLALPAVAIVDAVTGTRSSQIDKQVGYPELTGFLRVRQRVAVATGPALLTAIAAVLLLDLGTMLTGRAAAGLFAALGYALGTPAWGWSTTILGHAPVAALFVVAVWGVMRRTQGGAMLVGIALGATVVIELQSALAGGCIALWAVWRWRHHPHCWRMIVAAGAGGIVSLIPLGAYDLIAFGTPFRIGYSGVVGWEGMQHGLFGLGWPRPDVYRAITVGPQHGLMWVAPILILAPLGLAAWWERRPMRDLIVMILATCLVVLSVNAAYVYWQGGNSTGPRLSVPLVGVLSLGLAPAWMVLTSRGRRSAASALLALSIAVNAVIAAANIFAVPTFAFPLWSDVLAGAFARGEIVSLGSDYAGWSPWAGFAGWTVLAVPTIVWLAIRASATYSAAFCVTGASGSPQGSAGEG